MAGLLMPLTDIEDGPGKYLHKRSCFRFRRGAIYMVALEEHTYYWDLMGRRREVMVGKVRVQWAWRRYSPT
jgi:hypothetical protein